MIANTVRHSKFVPGLKLEIRKGNDATYLCFSKMNKDKRHVEMWAINNEGPRLIKADNGGMFGDIVYHIKNTVNAYAEKLKSNRP